jgi:hypothetical protein
MISGFGKFYFMGIKKFIGIEGTRLLEKMQLRGNK